MRDVGEQLAVKWRRLQENEAAWPELVMDFACELLTVRETFTNAGKGDDSGFGRWLAKHQVHIGHQDRAAYINLARHADVALPVLRKTSRRSVRLIWAVEVQPLLNPKTKPDPAAIEIGRLYREGVACMVQAALGLPEEAARAVVPVLLKQPNRDELVARLEETAWLRLRRDSGMPDQD